MANKYAPIIEELQGHFPSRSLSRLPLDEAHLDKIEAQLGHKLPADYCEFLRDYAGVGFNCACYPVQEDGFSSEESIFMFFGSSEERTLADGYHNGIKNFTEFDSGNGEEIYPGIHLIRDDSTPFTIATWPPELLAIGSDKGGNQICLALFGLRTGAVFFWRNAPYSDAQNLYLIADSFDEFMNLLRPSSMYEQ